MSDLNGDVGSVSASAHGSAAAHGSVLEQWIYSGIQSDRDKDRRSVAPRLV
jgi:hypothetical protein